MNIDINTILTSLISSVTVAGMIIYVAKKGFEKILDHKFKEAEENIKEKNRREAKIYDDQYAILKSSLSIFYRLRNKARDITENLDKQSVEIEEQINELTNLIKLLRELLLAERALIPEHLFTLLHELIHCVAKFKNIVKFVVENKTKENKEKYLKDIKNSYIIINKSFEIFDKDIRKIIY